MPSSDPLLAILDQAAAARSFRMVGAGGAVTAADEMLQAARQASRRLAMERVGPGDVILYQGPQGPEAITLFWAAALRGAVFAPLDQGWPDYLVRRVVDSLRVRLAVSGPEGRGLYRELFPEAPHLGLADWRRWLAEADLSDPDTPLGASDDQPAAYLFTSGSTGVPKAVALSRRALAVGARLTVDTFEWQPGEALVNLPEPHTMSGLRNGFVAAPLAGVRLHVLPPERRGNIFELLDGLAEAGCQRLVAGPLLIRQMVMLGERVDPAALSALKAIYCTGASLSPAAVLAFHGRFGIPIINYYGLTETGGICISQRIAGWRPDDRSLGVAAGAELRVVDGDAPPTREGVGELQVRSGQLMSGYVGDPERTAKRFADGWLRTGDRMRLDPDGRCYLEGRLDGFLKTASTDRVAPEEIETVLEEHPAVVEAAVLGLRTDDEVERVVALVALRNATTEAAPLGELASFVRERLGPARTPSRIQVVERLPRWDSGKIIRGELRGLLRDT